MSWLAFTVDVEEWFHILDVDTAPPRETWSQQPARVERNTRVLLDHLDAARVRGTFFTLGWIGERYPDLVREIAQRGHEVACHGHEHKLAFEIGPEAFRADAERAKRTLEDVIGASVVGYRAAGFSITPGTPWAFDELAHAGFRYDSSVFPARRGHGGFAGGLSVPHRIRGPAGGEVVEFPIPPLHLGPVAVPYAGGGYLRLFPAPFVRAFAKRSLRCGIPVNIYVHPRDVDADQPRLELSLKRRFRTYVNVARGERKVKALLAGFPPDRFRRLADVLGDLISDAALPLVQV
ncbi:MAG TPA: XrtA system polysaccharide deacetylase [Myxococcota bacterium]|nr:XrtA system polysaccharide deacetylase [Myxococcota bacterium]